MHQTDAQANGIFTDDLNNLTRSDCPEVIRNTEAKKRASRASVLTIYLQPLVGEAPNPIEQLSFESWLRVSAKRFFPDECPDKGNVSVPQWQSVR